MLSRGHRRSRYGGVEGSRWAQQRVHLPGERPNKG